MDVSDQLHASVILTPGKESLFLLNYFTILQNYVNHFDIRQIHLQTFMQWYNRMLLYRVTFETINLQHSGAVSEMYVSVFK
jgi:hypothetical protein